MIPRWQKGTAILPLDRFTLQCDYRYYPGDPGSFGGPPDTWTPPDPDEIEIISVSLAEGSLRDILEELNALSTIEEMLLERIRGGETPEGEGGGPP